MSASRRRGLFACLAFVVMGLALVGCTKPVPTEAEIVGTWVSEGTDGWGEPGGTMVFNADGTFTAVGVPEGLLDSTFEATVIDGDGTWAIDDGAFGSDPNYFDPGVEIVYPAEPPRVVHKTLVFSNSGDTLTLTYWNSHDLFERYVLVKQD